MVALVQPNGLSVDSSDDRGRASKDEDPPPGMAPKDDHNLLGDWVLADTVEGTGKSPSSGQAPRHPERMF